IYSELGHTLKSRGDFLSSDGDHKQSKKCYAEAAQAFADAIRENPSSAELQMYLGLAREAQGLNPEALKAYLESVRLSPHHAALALPKAHRLFSPELAESLGDWLESSWRPAVESLQLEKEISIPFYHFLGRASLYRGAYQRAVEQFHRALAGKPDDLYI